MPVRADLCPAGVTTVVIDGAQMALQVHESCGHATELDRALGYEANFAGTSFVTTDQRGKLQYGSKLMNVTVQLSQAAAVPGPPLAELARGFAMSGRVLDPKGQGIAGADVTEFGQLADPDAALALVRRGWETFMRLSKVPYPTLALVRDFAEDVRE